MVDDQNQQYIGTLQAKNDTEKKTKASFFDRLLYWVQHNFSLAILILVCTVLVEVLWGMQVVRKLQSQLAAKKSVQSTTASPVASATFPTTFALGVENNEATVGATIPITVTLDTAGMDADGATAVLTYDPKLLAFVRIENGPIFKEYTKAKVDQAKGQITLTGLAGVKTFFNGKGIFAKALFTTKAKGEATVDFDFRPNRTDETTLASQGKEVLGSVRGVRIAIK